MSTPTITLSQLHSEMLRIYAHPLSSTNITGIQHTAGGAVFFETDTSELEANLAEARQSEARLKAELKEANEEIERAEAERDKAYERNEELLQMHDAFKDPASGITPATYRQQAEDAEAMRADYGRAMTEARAELLALRKRKGIECELFKNAREIQDFLQLCAAGKLQPAAVALHATELRTKLYTK